MAELIADSDPSFHDPDWIETRAKLLSDPDRVRGDAALLDALGLRFAPANVVEFGPTVLARYEEARTREAGVREELEAMAVANLTAQVETHAAVLDLLGARNNADLARRVDETARYRFRLSVGTIAMEGFGAPAGWRGLRQGMVSLLMGESAIRMGLATARDELFGDAAGQVKSFALARLSVFEPERPGVLAFGSAEEDGFTGDMGAELIAFLARVVERTADRWPLV